MLTEGRGGKWGREVKPTPTTHTHTHLHTRANSQAHRQVHTEYAHDKRTYVLVGKRVVTMYMYAKACHDYRSSMYVYILV